MEKSDKPNFDLVIIGAGVVGLAIGEYFIRKYPNWSIVVIEKNSKHGQGISSRNSEVIHAGIYYPKNWLKSKLCIKGRRLLYPLLEKHGIPHKKIGKLIVATDNSQIDKLDSLFNNAIEKGVEGLTTLTQEEVRVIEPNINCVKAIFSEESGIVSADRLMDVLLAQFKMLGGHFLPETKFLSSHKISNGFKLTLKSMQEGLTKITTQKVVNSAGLYADEVSQKAGYQVDERIHFCKGHFFQVPDARNTLNHLVYPLPTETFLGIHTITGLNGEVKLGPDAVYLEDNVENYSQFDNVENIFRENVEQYWKSLKDYEIIPDMVGIRTKLYEENEPQKDFVIKQQDDGWISLLGIESPGLTSSLAFGEYIENTM
ncbi:MAG: NAD(P)/FAD-dependent oxidoreductase [Candidatus Marinimicrobia bacterium]|nr:NAD(P)/FAD-dependent oxidoreductase [Candidatus Neomarinimicrobiota bacterium]MBL7023085.1 NAD(P)/FAD-dependent oxidoreductase [Candidatus Neomarinimicrobiota bacterium]MBL7109105.1 NAD(P)/FAD-dependent oxidoreductase [Candidatus Neomarinimicrobiota bacterium]